ncbi:MAG: glycoside hydrolase family 3 N-terminal domain-containing protein [Actinomycetota bacterium]
MDKQERLGELTLDEKCELVVGKDSWTVNGCERLGIPEWTTSDGPVGVRGRGNGVGLVMPGPSALAATWDPEAVEEVGEVLARECVDRSVDLLLAPTTNLHRSPLAGRHFESYSEEPVLSSRLAVAFITGVQAMGVGACIKHFVANDQETNRMTIDVRVDERALREVYLPPFESAVREAGVRAVMAAYNYVNGTHACAHSELLDGVLRDEWGFEGIVVSDWFAMKDTLGPALNGLDLEMPGPGLCWGAGKLADSVRAGAVSEAAIDDKVLRVLEFLDWRGRLDSATSHSEVEHSRSEDTDVAYRAALGACVLVKNENQTLPIAPDTSVALIGPAWEDFTILGGGSASLRPLRQPDLLGQLRSRLGDGCIGFVGGPERSRVPHALDDEWLIGDPPALVEVFDGWSCQGPPLMSSAGTRVRHLWTTADFLRGRTAVTVRQQVTIRPPRPGDYRVCALAPDVVTVYLNDTKIATSLGNDLKVDMASAAATTVTLEGGRTYVFTVEAVCDLGKFPGAGIDFRMDELTDDFDDICQRAEELAAIADLAVVAVGSTPQWESEAVDRPELALPARQSDLVRRVLAAQPNTAVLLNCGAPVELPWIDDVRALLLAWYPGQEGDRAVTDILTGQCDPEGRMPTTWARRIEETPANDNFPGDGTSVTYDEGVFVGFRHFDRHEIEPLIPFGHGGSYTTFQWGDASVDRQPDQWLVRVPVTNTGHRRGSEVVQAYVGPAERQADRPDKVLAGFAKIRLDPGETKVATVELARRSFEVWDTKRGSWRLPSGQYAVSIGASATDLRSRTVISVGEVQTTDAER